MGLQNTINDIQRQRQSALAYATSKTERDLTLATISRLKIYGFLALFVAIVSFIVFWDYTNVTAPGKCYKQCEKRNLIGYESINCFQKCEK